MLDKAIEMYEPLVMAQLRGANGKELMNEQIKFNRETKQDLENLMSKYNISGEELYKAIVEKNKGEIEQYTAQKQAETAQKDEERLKSYEIEDFGTRWFKGNKTSNNTWTVNDRRYTYTNVPIDKVTSTLLRRRVSNKDGDFVEYKGKYYVYENGEFKEVRRI